MSFEEAPIESSETTPIQLTKEEFDLIRSVGMSDNNNEKAQEIIAEKGIKIDSGIIDVEIDGVKKKMTTQSDDFGTTITDGPTIPSGY